MNITHRNTNRKEIDFFPLLKHILAHIIYKRVYVKIVYSNIAYNGVVYTKKYIRIYI